MSLRWIAAVALVSTLGFTPAPSSGQSVETPRSFQAFADGRDVVVRWTSEGEADLYIGEIDGDPDFDSPARWTVREDGRRTYEHRIRDLAEGTYYVRLRALESFLVIKRQSDWTHVERVVVGRGGGVLFADRGDFPGRGTRVFPRSDDFPRRLDARALGNDLRLSWSPVRGAESYVVQLDDDRSFRNPWSFGVDELDDRSVQEFLIRDVPRGRWYVRVRAVDSFVVNDPSRWSPVEVVDVGFGDRVFRRQVDFRDGRRVVVLRPERHSVFHEPPGRGKGHLKHRGKPDTPGHARDPDHDDDWDD